MMSQRKYVLHVVLFVTIIRGLDRSARGTSLFLALRIAVARETGGGEEDALFRKSSCFFLSSSRAALPSAVISAGRCVFTDAAR